MGEIGLLVLGHDSRKPDYSMRRVPHSAPRQSSAVRNVLAIEIGGHKKIPRSTFVMMRFAPFSKLTGGPQVFALVILEM